MSNEPTPTLINDKWKIVLPEHRSTSLVWSQWEKERNLALNKNIKEGDVLIDVGSESGDLPCMFSMWGAEVFMIEPNPLFWATIKQIWGMNAQTPLGCFAGFASNKDVQPTDLLESPFRIPGDGLWPGCAFMDAHQNNDFRNVLERAHDTPQTTIDSLVFNDTKILAPSIINIDCEGAEWEVLKGAADTLDVHMPLVFVSVHPEFMVNDYGYTKEDLLFWMSELGYEAELLAIDHEHHYSFWHPEGKPYVR